MRVLLFLCFLNIILFGCHKTKSQLTLAVGGAPNEVSYWQRLLKEFTEKTHIQVSLLRQPSDTDLRRQNLVIPLKAKKQDPDVFLMDVAWVSQFAASHWLLALDDYIKKDNFDLNNLFIIKQIDIYQNSIIALPVYMDCGLLYYRKDLLKKYKLPVPKTWEEVLRYAQFVQIEERKCNPNFYGFVWQGAQYEGLICNFMEFVVSHGGRILDQNKCINLNSKENIKALKFMRDLIHKYKISPPNTYTEMKEEEVRLFFQNGNALFERNWPYAFKLHNTENSFVRNKIGVTILPKNKNGKHATTLGGWHIGISKYADKKEAAWRLISFILSYETQKKFALELGWNPSRKDIYDDPEVNGKLPHMTTLKKALEHVVIRPNVPYYSQISQILQKYINAAISGKMSPEKALQEAQKAIKILEQAYHE